MPYLVDGNNLIGAARDLDLKDAGAREKLTQLLGRFQRAKRNRVTVVYDGPPPAGARKTLHLGGLMVIYAGPEKDADSVIREIIAASPDPRSWTVITTDRQVYSWCRWAGAQAKQSRDFCEELIAVSERRPGAGKNGDADDDIEEWLEYFGIEDDGGDDGQF
jgi:predicted RNA-binding protein with PIN domain